MVKPETSGNGSGQDQDDSGVIAVNVGRSVLGWGVLFVILVALSDIEATAELAAAFAWLIFVGVMLLYGPQALDTISNLVESQS